MKIVHLEQILNPITPRGQILRAKCEGMNNLSKRGIAQFVGIIHFAVTNGEKDYTEWGEINTDVS